MSQDNKNQKLYSLAVQYVETLAMLYLDQKSKESAQKEKSRILDKLKVFFPQKSDVEIGRWAIYTTRNLIVKN